MLITSLHRQFCEGGKPGSHSFSHWVIVGASLCQELWWGLLAMQVPNVTAGETEVQEASVVLPSSAELFCGGNWNSRPALLSGWVFPCLLHTLLPISAHRNSDDDQRLPSLPSSSFLLLIYILLNDEIIQYIIPQQLCCLKKNREWSN